MSYRRARIPIRVLQVLTLLVGVISALMMLAAGGLAFSEGPGQGAAGIVGGAIGGAVALLCAGVSAAFLEAILAIFDIAENTRVTRDALAKLSGPPRALPRPADPIEAAEVAAFHRAGRT